jgi:hypothetical protein
VEIIEPDVVLRGMATVWEDVEEDSPLVGRPGTTEDTLYTPDTTVPDVEIVVGEVKVVPTQNDIVSAVVAIVAEVPEMVSTVPAIDDDVSVPMVVSENDPLREVEDAASPEVGEAGADALSSAGVEIVTDVPNIVRWFRIHRNHHQVRRNQHQVHRIRTECVVLMPAP